MKRIFWKTKKDKDLKEIFSHVKQIKLEREQTENVDKEEFEPVKTIQDNVGIIAGEIDDTPPEDIFEIVETIDEFSEEKGEFLEETVSKMKVDVNSPGICDMCGQKIHFEKNLSGLVINDKIFACEKCCQDASEDELNSWTESKMANPQDVRPIALWLMQEKNRTQLFEE